jgi:hypothetical protein
MVGGRPLYYTERSTSSNSRGELHEAPYAAAHIVDTLLILCRQRAGAAARRHQHDGFFAGTVNLTLPGGDGACWIVPDRYGLDQALS